MTAPLVHIETLQDPDDYPKGQIVRAWAIASMLALVSPDDRGKFVLVEPPEGD